MNRRDVLKALALGGSSLPLLTQTQAAEFAVKIAPLEMLKSEWDNVKFTWIDDAALLTRVPKPAAPDVTLLEVNGVYLSAYLLTCTHEGCTVKLPNSDHKLECPCHGSVFNAVDVARTAASPARACSAYGWNCATGMCTRLGF